MLGNTYVNVHSTVNGGGEIRGQLVEAVTSVLRSFDGGSAWFYVP